MTNPTWDGIEIDYTDLQIYGWYRTNITVGGESYPLLTGYQVAGLREMDTRLAAAGGAIASIRYAWDTGTTDADPGTGEVRGNNATIASITTLYASTSDTVGASVSAIIDTWDDSTSTVKGAVRLAHRTDASKWAQFTLSAVTSATGYRKLTVSYVAGSGTLSAADPVALGFVRTGDKGDTGSVTSASSMTISDPAYPRLSYYASGVLQIDRFYDVANNYFFNDIARAGAYERWRDSAFGAIMDIRDDGVVALGGGYGAESVRVERVASVARRITLRGAVAGEDPTIGTSGGGLKIGTAARSTPSALTDGATITPDFNASNDFTVTLGGSRTLANPTNIAVGQGGSIFITQDGTGSRTLSYGSYWDFAGGTAPVLSTAAGAVDRLDYVVRTTTSIHAILTKAYS